jgi:hypothetical protein
MQNNDLNPEEDSLFDKLNKITIGKLSRGESISHANKDRMTDEVRKKLSESHKGKEIAEETKQKIKKWYKEVGFSEEAKKKMSEGSKSKVIGEETRKRLSEMNKGRKFTQEHRENLSKNKQNKPYAIYKDQTYTLTELCNLLGFSEKIKMSRIKSGQIENTWGIIFLETQKPKRRIKPLRSYAIYNGETLNIEELSEKTGFNRMKISQIKAGNVMNHLNITFL